MTLTKEQINLAFDAWKRDALIAGIAPADWQERIEAIRTMALSHADAYERGQRDMAAAAVKVLKECADRYKELTTEAQGLGQAHRAEWLTNIELALLRALNEIAALSPGEWVAVPADGLQAVIAANEEFKRDVPDIRDKTVDAIDALRALLAAKE